MRRLLALPMGVAPERPLLAELRAAWGNDRCAADLDFLSEVARLAAVTLGPVLECGSGLTTLLLGALAGRRGVEVWALEHEPEWRRRVAAALRDHKAGQVYLWFSPLSDYGEFVWYAAPLPLMPDAFRLVVCDGPPRLPATTSAGSPGKRAPQDGGWSSSGAAADSSTRPPASVPAPRQGSRCSPSCATAMRSSALPPACAVVAASAGGRVTSTSR